MPKLIQPKDMPRSGRLRLTSEIPEELTYQSRLDRVWHSRLDELPDDFSKHYPLKFEELDGQFEPGDMVQWCSSSARFVSARFKALIEEVEPGVHTFIPIEITLKDGSIRKDYSLLKIGNILKSVVPEKSDIGALTIPNRQTGEKMFVRYSYSIVAKLTFKRDVIGGCVLWLGHDLSASDIFCADEFIDLMIERDIHLGIQKRGNIFFDDEVVG